MYWSPTSKYDCGRGCKCGWGVLTCSGCHLRNMLLCLAHSRHNMHAHNRPSLLHSKAACPILRHSPFVYGCEDSSSSPQMCPSLFHFEAHSFCLWL